ncbi:hypothetical protein NKDENANG_00938 [Candidatus Entotheonellaceae bacterium PAL068K]
MLRHIVQPPPEYIYPIDAWKIIEKRFYPCFLVQMETIFCIGNNDLGAWLLSLPPGWATLATALRAMRRRSAGGPWRRYAIATAE